MTTSKNEKILATCTNYWDDEIKIVDVNGTLYKEVGGNRKPMRFNVHDGGGDGPDGDILNHENLRWCGWEVCEDSNRHFRGAVVLPSDCFNQDIEQEDDLSKEAVEAVKDWAKADLEIADKATIDYVKPLEMEDIRETFSDWLDDLDDDDERCDEEKIQDFIDEEQADETFFWFGGRVRGLIQFHDEEEIREICLDCLK